VRGPESEGAGLPTHQARHSESRWSLGLYEGWPGDRVADWEVVGTHSVLPGVRDLCWTQFPGVSALMDGYVSECN
jgi:hypothetical protein